ncbi:hypothetical protein A2U01_0104465, partial [Trifolium medium]|nr:hypothetical protein [Trifolium medium]
MMARQTTSSQKLRPKFQGTVSRRQKVSPGENELICPLFIGQITTFYMILSSSFHENI